MIRANSQANPREGWRLLIGIGPESSPRKIRKQFSVWTIRRSSFGANVGPLRRHRGTYEQDQENQHDRHGRRHPKDIEVRER